MVDSRSRQVPLRPRQGSFQLTRRSGSSARLSLPLAVWLLRSPTLRFSAVLVGALAVFQSSDALSPGKLAYFTLFAACFVTSLVRVLPRLRDDRWAPFRLLPWASALFGTYLVSTLYVSTTSGTQPVDWLRDVVPYLLLSTMPIIALDAGMSMRHETAVRLTAIVGVLAVIGFTITFLTRRDFSTLPVARLLLASLTLCCRPIQLFPCPRPSWTQPGSVAGVLRLRCRAAAIHRNADRRGVRRRDLGRHR